MTPPGHPVEHWIESLVDRTAGQLRAELDALVSQLQEAAVARAAEHARASESGGCPDRRASSSASRPPLDLRTAAGAVLEAVVALDSARSLSDTLDILADRAARHADRVLLVVIQVLARHAARCLESMTARRVPELVRAAAAALEA